MKSDIVNIASERAVLAGICKYGIDAYAEVEALLNENTFTVNNNKLIYKCIKHILVKSNIVDFAGLLSAAKDLNLDEFLDKHDGLKHIQAILAMPISLENVREHATKIRKLQFARELQLKLKEANAELEKVKGNETLSQILAYTEGPLQELSLSYMRGDNNTPQDLGDGLDEFLDYVENNPSDIIGISTGFKQYDLAIGGGLRRKTLNLIGARNKIGKSSIADNIAINITARGTKVLVLDTEMSKEDHWHRMIASIAKVKINEVATGQYSKKQELRNRVRQAADLLKKYPYKYLNISGRAFEDTLSIMRRWILKDVGYSNGTTNECLIIYDYLKLMDSEQINNNLAEYQVMGFQATSLHNFAVQYDCPILSFVQLNRDGMTKESSDVIAQSDRIGWLCSNFTILKPKTEDEIANDGIKAGNRKLVVTLARHGPGTEESGYICMQMDKDYASFREIGLARELKKDKGLPDADKGSNTGPTEFA